MALACSPPDRPSIILTATTRSRLSCQALNTLHAAATDFLENEVVAKSAISGRKDQRRSGHTSGARLRNRTPSAQLRIWEHVCAGNNTETVQAGPERLKQAAHPSSTCPAVVRFPRPQAGLVRGTASAGDEPPAPPFWAPSSIALPLRRSRRARWRLSRNTPSAQRAAPWPPISYSACMARRPLRICLPSDDHRFSRVRGIRSSLHPTHRFCDRRIPAIVFSLSALAALRFGPVRC